MFAIDLARVTAAGFLATTLGTSVFKTESLDIRGILGTIATLMTPMDQPTAFLVGTGWHCLNEIAFAAIYARILIALRKQSTVITGVLAWPCAMSSPHAHSADSIQRGSAGSIRSTAGMFLLHTGMGWTPALFVLLDHLVYGLLVGVIYCHRVVRGSTRM